MTRPGLSLLLLCIFLAGCGTPSPESIVVPTSYAASPNNPIKPRQLTKLDLQVHSYLETVWSWDKTSTSKDMSVATGLVAASDEFNKSIVDLYQTYLLVSKENARLKISENEINARVVPELIEMGFKKSGDKWFYNSRAVNFGQDLIGSDSLAQNNKTNKIDVQFTVDVSVSELRYVKVIGTTNLPDFMTVTIKLKKAAFNASQQATVKGGKFESNWISDPSQPGDRMPAGKYTIEISSSIPDVQDAAARYAIGPLGRNLTGSYVKYSPGLDNKVVYARDITIE